MLKILGVVLFAFGYVESSHGEGLLFSIGIALCVLFLYFLGEGLKVGVVHVKAGSTEEPLVARSETRFSDPWGSIFEFQLDAAGTVTGLIQQQGQLKIQASRIR